VNDLITWLRACLNARERELDEDERVAREATPGPWSVDAMRTEPTADVVAVGSRITSAYSEPCCSIEDAQHIARWDPARVLARVATERADVDAKRRILDEAERYSPELSHGDNGEWAFDVVIRLLALPYAERSGYDEARCDDAVNPLLRALVEGRRFRFIHPPSTSISPD
jgi:hypothetical protein